MVQKIKSHNIYISKQYYIKRTKIMKKIAYNDLKMVETNLNFYDFDGFFSEERKILYIEFCDKINLVRYEENGLLKKAGLFEEEVNILLTIVEKLFGIINEDLCIIRKNNWRWILHKNISLELYSELDNNSIYNRFKGGILVKKNDYLIKMFNESAFKNNSFIQFIFVKSEIIISPTDHMDILIHARNIENIEDKINKIIMEFGDNKLFMKIKNQ
jgi:hypothetical protein